MNRIYQDMIHNYLYHSFTYIDTKKSGIPRPFDKKTTIFLLFFYLTVISMVLCTPLWA